jgi:hypothetical protein
MADDLIPISDEQAKLGTKALEVLQDFGGFLRDVLGTVPEDLVGILGGDWLKVQRAMNLAEMFAKARARMEAKGITKPQHLVSLSLALPLFRAAADESRTELQDLYARLLAAAADPSRSGAVRRSFIDIVQQMEPIDALVLRELANHSHWSPNVRDALADRLKIPGDQIEVSLRNLTRLECAHLPNITAVIENVNLSATGRELMRALRD